ncbi:MAG: molybdopterin-dependent oxidoreductase [Desulfitobacterium sp.]
MNAKSGARGRVKDPQVLVAVSNDWLQLPIIDMLSAQREGYIRVKSLAELYQRVKEFSRCIVIIDIFTYAEHHQDILKRLYEENPCLSIIPLVSKDKLAYAQYLDSSASCYSVAKEDVDTQLMPVLGCAYKDQRLIADAYALLREQKQLPTLNKKEANLMKKEDGSIFGRKFGRRSFLKGSAAAAAVAGVAVASPGNTVMKALAATGNTTTMAPEEKVFPVVCRGNCVGTCQMNAHVRNGKLVKMSKREAVDPRYTRICQRGRTNPLRVYSPERLKYPMRRVGERGEGKWEQISWDEAIDEICTKWKGYQKEHGKESIFFASGSGNYGSEVRNYSTRLVNFMGASRMSSALDSAVVVSAGRALGYGAYLGANSPTDWVNSNYIFVWGTNFTQAWNANWHFLAEAQKAGAKMICIDPVFNIVASKSDMFVPIRPCTDALLAMAMTQIVIDEGLADEKYLKKCSVAPFMVKESDGRFMRLSDLGKATAGTATDAIVVRGVDGSIGVPADIPDPVLHGTFTINDIKVTTAYDLLIERLTQFPPDNAAKVCDIPLETIKNMARMFAEGPACIAGGYGPDHYTNGHHAYQAMYTLLMVTGNFGKPGTGLAGGFNFSLGLHGPSTNSMDNPKNHLSSAPNVPSVKMLDVIKTGKYGDISVTPKSMFVQAFNVIGNLCERKAYLEVFNKLDLVVVADITMSETASYADIVLPVPHWFEVDSLVNFGTQFVSISDKAIEPLYECKGDFEIINLLGEGMDLGSEFPLTKEEYFTRSFENDYSKSIGLSYERLKKEKQLPTWIGDYIHGAGGVYPTTTGRAQFYLENVVPNFRYGQVVNLDNSRLPYWEQPIEAWHDYDLAKKYPLIFTSERARFHCHTQFGDVQWFKELEPEPFVRISLQDAATRGISNGDTVKVFNDRGYVVVKAVIHNGIRPGMLVMPHAWQKHHFIDGHYSDLSSRATNPDVANNAFFDALCEIQKM